MTEQDPYYTIAGIIQFDPEQRDVNGKSVTQFSIRNISGQKNVRVTVWPELQVPPLKKGDGVMVDGKFSTQLSQDGAREFHNLSATTIVLLGSGYLKQQAAPAVAQRTSDSAAF